MDARACGCVQSDLPGDTVTTSREYQFKQGRTPTRVIALDWYDGPILGLVEYEVNGESDRYKFGVVGGVVDDSRFFLLADATTLEWENAISLLRETSLPGWPVWALHVRGSSTDWRDKAQQMVQQISESINPPLALIEAESIERPIIAARRILEDERTLVTNMAEQHQDHNAWAALLSS